MNPGMLRKKLEFYELEEGFDDSGAPEGSYQEVPAFTVWGRYTGTAPGDNADGLFEIRYRDDIAKNHKVIDVETGNVYKVADVYDPDGRRRRLHIVFKEVT